MVEPAGSSNSQLFQWAKKLKSLFISSPAGTVVGRAAGAGAGDVGPLTAQQVLDILNTLSTFLITVGSGGAEGGEIHLLKPPSGSSLSGDVAIDINTNAIRVFENGGSARGFFCDLTALASSAGTNLRGVFDSSNDGLVPASGGGTTNFLRADGTFAAPGSGGLTLVSDQGAVGTGTTYTVTGLGGYKWLLCCLRDVSHNSGSSQAFRVELSGNGGSTFGTPIALLGGSAFTAATLANGWFAVTRTDKTNDQQVSISTLGGVTITDTSARGPIDCLRFSFAGGNFDSGVIDIYGLK